MTPGIISDNGVDKPIQSLTLTDHIPNIVSAVAPTGRVHADRPLPASYRIYTEMPSRIMLIANVAIPGVAAWHGLDSSGILNP